MKKSTKIIIGILSAAVVSTAAFAVYGIHKLSKELAMLSFSDDRELDGYLCEVPTE